MVPMKHQGLLFGGWLGEAGYSDDLFSIAQSRDAASSVTVSKYLTTGEAPSARAGHASCAAGDSLMFVHGGAGGAKSHLADLFVLDSETLEWSQETGTGKAEDAPLGRSRHAMESVGDAVYIFCGVNDVQDFDDVWSFSLSSRAWSKCATQGPGPSARWGLTASAVGSKIFVWGGQSSTPSAATTKTLTDMFVLDTNTLTWECLSIEGAPAARGGHTATIMAERYLVIFGGGDGATMSNGLYAFDTAVLEWVHLPLFSFAALVPPRWAHTAVALDGQLMICCGANGPITFGEILSVGVDLLLAKHVAERVGGSLDLSLLFAPPQGSLPTGSGEIDLSSLNGSGNLPRSVRLEPLQMWLRSVGAEELYSVFVTEGITMRLIPLLTEEHLIGLKITSLSMRLSILAGAQQLQPPRGPPVNSHDGEHLATITVALHQLTKMVERIGAAKNDEDQS